MMEGLMFSSPLISNKINYIINKGNWKFEDATAASLIKSDHKWHTGVTMVDINSDGWLGYLCL
jgi:hypothetical protein